MAPTQDSDANELVLAPPESGNLTSDHFVPFQRSAIGPLAAPIAMHLDGLVQETADNVSPSGLAVAVDNARQVRPFHCSASPRTPDMPSPSLPTAMQEVALGHETDKRLASMTEDRRFGSGTDCSVHRFPFQISAIGTDSDAAFVELPTAMHDFGDVHEMPASPLPCSTSTLGIDWVLHDDPFHASPSQRDSRFQSLRTPSILDSSRPSAHCRLHSGSWCAG